MLIFILISLIIPFVVSWLWFELSKDKINNEDQKIRFLHEEFDYLVDSKVEILGYGSEENKKVEYITSKIIVKRPKKIKIDKWKVYMDLEYNEIVLGKLVKKHEDSVEIFNILDIELEEKITKHEKLDIITTLKETIIGRTILNSDYKSKKVDSFDNNYPEGHPLRKK